MSTELQSDTKLSADLQLKPELSQISIIVLLIIAELSLLTSFYFSWHGKPVVLPASVGLLCLGMSGFAWWKSQRAIDLSNSSPTQISNNHGVKVITDTRAVESDSTVKNIAMLLETMSVRERLPNADGLVFNGEILPDTKDEAVKAIETINNTTKVLEDEINDAQKESAKMIKSVPVGCEVNTHSGIAGK